MSRFFREHRAALAWGILVAAATLLPWQRNHSLLRDFYDYGLVAAGNARIAAGERPYVDFTTPIQSGIFWANLAAERLGDGTFLAMTRGAAALIVLSAVGLTLLLARRWPAWLAALAVAAILAGSAAQHTIIWHNSIGVVSLALVSWSAAIAPVWRRTHWPWHAVTALGLLVGGVNKLNFQLVALAAAAGWLLFAIVRNRGSGWRAVGTLTGLFVFGVALPVAVEIAWTGAPLQLWFYNVAQLATASRAEGLGEIPTWRFLTEPIHPYYGELRLPFVPLIGLLACAAPWAAAWRAGVAREARGRVRLFATSGTLAAFAAGAALLSTNFEIAYVGLAAWFVLAVALWLGFELPVRDKWFWAGIFAPAVLLVVTAGESAWRGQRSQFGHAATPRDHYLPAHSAGPEFAYLRGMSVPPDWIDSLRAIAQMMPPRQEDGSRSVFYGPGLEWLECAFPARKHGRLPLWTHWGTSYSTRELQQLGRLLDRPRSFELVLTPVAWDHWAPALRSRMESQFLAELAGPLVVARRPKDFRAEFRDAFSLVREWGGNLAINALDFPPPALDRTRDANGQLLLGVTAGTGRFILRQPSYRLSGEVVVQRQTPSINPLQASFSVNLAGSGHERWRADVVLGPDENEKTIAYLVDGSAQPLEFQVEIEPGQEELIFAGYRGPWITHAIGDSLPPPALRPTSTNIVPVSLESVRALLPSHGDKLTAAALRGARITESGFELIPGGEIWLRFEGPLAELSGHTWQPTEFETTAPPVLRAAWYKGGRFERMTEQGLQGAGHRTHFRLWSPEADGWHGIFLDTGAAASPAIIRIDRVEPAG